MGEPECIHEPVRIYPPGAEVEFMTNFMPAVPEPSEQYSLDHTTYDQLNKRQKFWARAGHLFLHRTHLRDYVESKHGVYCLDTFLEYRHDAHERRKHYFNKYMEEHDQNYFKVGVAMLMYELRKTKQKNKKEHGTMIYHGLLVSDDYPEERSKNPFKNWIGDVKWLGHVVKNSYWLSYERKEDESWLHWWRHATMEPDRKVSGGVLNYIEERQNQEEEL